MYHIVFALLYVVSLLPWRVLYVLSDLGCFILYRIIGYRKEVVAGNLFHAFPEKTAEERKKIERKFYKNFCDNWIETIKLLSITPKTIRKRFSGDASVFHDMYATGKAVQGNFGHFFNWEALNHFLSVNQPYHTLAIYFPQKNQVMDRLIKYVRARWGNTMIPQPEMARQIIPWRKKQYMIALIGDQSPIVPGASYWLNFMNRPTCFVKGPEKFARGQNIPVTMTITTKPKRGYYHFDSYLLAEDPSVLPEGEIMRRYVKYLEQNIRLQPELYLWSHRRWKHVWKAEYENLWIDTDPAHKG
jgi:KDO2-lipid IV(A) lauroyltransferase